LLSADSVAYNRVLAGHSTDLQFGT